MSCPAFIGRADELQVLTACFERARVGVPGTVLIEGDAGIGKSRLVEALEQHAENTGAVVATGRSPTCSSSARRP